MTVTVCRGTRTWGPRIRLWRRGEIVRITLRIQQNGQPGIVFISITDLLIEGIIHSVIAVEYFGEG